MRKFLALVLALLLVVIALPALAGGTLPSKTGETWEGSYTCPAGVNVTRSGASPQLAAEAIVAGVNASSHCTGSAPTGGTGVYYVRTYTLGSCTLMSATSATCNVTQSYTKYERFMSSQPWDVTSGSTTAQISLTRTSVAEQCPMNSTLTSPGTCTCGTGFQPNTAQTECVAECTQGGLQSSGFYDIGASYAGAPMLLSCKDGCEAVFDGISPAGSAIVGGVKRYFARGDYVKTGNQCSTPRDPGTPQETLPTDSCGPGQVMGEVNGKKVCAKSGDGQEADDSKQTSTETSKKTNPDGTSTETTTTTSKNADGSTTTKVTEVTKDASGNTTGTTTTITNTPPPIDGDSGGEGETPEDECAKNPFSAVCMPTPPPKAAPTPPSLDGLYDKKDKTLGDVMATHRQTLMQSPVGTGLVNFFAISGGGSCPTWSKEIPFLNVTLTLDQFCSDMAATALAVMRVCVLLVAAFFAFRVAVE